MIINNNNDFNTSVRNINARVDLYEGDTLADSYTKYYALKSFTIERVGESKFFGYGISQKLNVHLVDKDRQIYITTADNFEVFLSNGGSYSYIFPRFYTTEVHRNENTNELSITAYDAIYKAVNYTIADLGLVAPYSINDILTAVKNTLGFNGFGFSSNILDVGYDLNFETGANFDGTESVRDLLNWIAEAWQAVYYMNGYNNLIFKRMDVNGEPVFEIGKDAYFTLDNGENRRLATIVHATELGDNVSATTGLSGSTQYVRNNPLWELREDIGDLVNNAISAIGGLTINQFSCSWRGNPYLEIGDKFGLVTKDGNKVISYLLNDTISYDGSLAQETEWKYEETEAETESNPASLGDALKQTYARVDKANKQIELVASDNDTNGNAISALRIELNGISSTVSKTTEATTEALGNINGEIAELTQSVQTSITEEQAQILINSSLSNGVSKVETSTGFVFDETGLTVSKSDSEMSTTITEDGMRVYRDSTEVLVADHEGVKAEDLHATTYLIIGQNSRFEDMGSRTGCFWIGG